MFHTVNSDIFVSISFSRNFAYTKYPREVAKSLCCLLIYVNHDLLAFFFVPNKSLNIIREGNILPKFPIFLVFTYL